MIKAGDVVVAVKDGTRGKYGPAVVPQKGKIYRVTSVYPMCYGLGVTLDGLDPAPYLGYFLFVDAGCALMCFGRPIEDGWYFRKVEKADKEFTEQMRKLKPKRDLSKVFGVPIRIKEKARGYTHSARGRIRAP